MSNIILLENMLALQDTLNIKTCGEDWKNGTTSEGRDITWDRYLRMELAEMIDSSSRFKHWKDLNADIDWDNMRMEVVDGWHFLMSGALVHYNISSITSLCTTHLTNMIPVDTPDYFDTVTAAEGLMASTLCYKENSMARKIYTFFNLLATIGMSFEELYKQYIVKNTLNAYRQDNGYKDGSYVKVIDGLEDNVIIMGMITHNPTLSPEELYNTYDAFYKEKTN